MELYLVRHGQSASNIGLKVHDPPLTELGHKQAQLVGEAIPHDAANPQPGGIGRSERKLSAVYASPMRRSIQTAYEIAKSHDVGVTVHPLFHESYDEPPNGMLKSDIEKAFPGIQFDESMPDGPWWQKHPFEEHFQTGFRSIRAAAWLRTTYQDSDDIIAVVGHGTFNAFLVGAIMGCGPNVSYQGNQRNCCLNRFIIKHDRNWVGYVNNLNHLPEDMWT